MPLPSHPLATAALFVLTAVMEILGCYLPYLWLRGKAGAWVLLPAALALDGVRPTPWDLTGSAVALAGMLIIVWGWRQQG